MTLDINKHNEISVKPTEVCRLRLETSKNASAELDDIPSDETPLNIQKSR